MKTTYEIMIGSDHVLVVCNGEFDGRDAREIFRAAFAAAAKHRLMKLLIDARGVTGKPNTMERFDMGENLSRLYAERAHPGAMLIALVGREPLADPHRFGELVARNRGFPGKFTTDIAEAREYLGLTGSDSSD
jgi:hypothetical protein